MNVATGWYFAMRVLRRMLPGAIPSRLAPLIPGMRRNAGTDSGARVIRLYASHLAPLDPQWLTGKTVLEIGIGQTNSSCYEMAARGAAMCHAFEPFVPLDEARDRRLLAACAAEHRVESAALSARVQRSADTRSLPPQSIDLVVSNSVLEHVLDLDALFSELRRLLRPGGRMLHIVDYRDHYFTFPYHHLLWSRRTWQRYLDPGDLPRWRLGDHVRTLDRHGMRVTVLRASPVAGAFEKVRARIHPEFHRYSAQDLETAFGVLLCARE